MSALCLPVVRSALAGGRIEVEAADVREGDFTAAAGFYRIHAVTQVMGGRGSKRRVVQYRYALGDGRVIEAAPDALVKIYRAQ